MAITPINFAMIQRADDVGMIKRTEDSKPLVDQQNIQQQVDEREDILNHQVNDPGNSERMKNDADARDEGKGKYSASQKKRAKKSVEEKTDRVIKKQSSGSFDIKI